MLCVEDDAGVPTMAKIVKLRAYDPVFVDAGAIASGGWSFQSGMPDFLTELALSENAYLGGYATTLASTPSAFQLDFSGEGNVDATKFSVYAELTSTRSCTIKLFLKNQNGYSYELAELLRPSDRVNLVQLILRDINDSIWFLALAT